MNSTFPLPLGLALNLTVNRRDYLVPMAVEEPSVVAAVSFAAKTARACGGFIAEADPPLAIAQLQIVGTPDAHQALKKLEESRSYLLGGGSSDAEATGASGLEFRLLPPPEKNGEPLLIVHALLDPGPGEANRADELMAALAPLLAFVSGGRVYAWGLSHLSDRRLVRSRCRIPFTELDAFHLTGEELAQGVVQASLFAEGDPYRAATHNKGVMNGIDPAAIAAGQDWRAIEAGAHAFVCREGRYRPVSTWRMDDEALTGQIELPLPISSLEGASPKVRLMHKLMGSPTPEELAMVLASLGLAQNFSALRALGSVGIQRGHMALHARCVAASAGAPTEMVPEIAEAMVKLGDVKIARARELLAAMMPVGQA
jgi:hydroxymethylglutaryl-CoA reductase